MTYLREVCGKLLFNWKMHLITFDYNNAQLYQVFVYSRADRTNGKLMLQISDHGQWKEMKIFNRVFLFQKIFIVCFKETNEY